MMIVDESGSTGADEIFSFQGLPLGNGTKPLKLASAPRLMPLQAEGVLPLVTVTVALLVTEPTPFVAVSVYAVVTDGDTVVEPLAAVDVNPPGVIAMVVASLEAQLSVLLAPALMLEGLAVNEAIVGFEPPDAVTVTVATLVTEPVLFMAVSVYAVVTDGDTVVSPLAVLEVNPPGLIAMLVAPLEAQLSVLLAPVLIADGLAANWLMVGAAPGFGAGDFVTPVQLARSMAKITRANRARK